MTERLAPMSTTAETANDTHVSCDQFCGMRITMTGEAGAAQHAENCGANADDLKALDDALIAKRVHSAATAAVEPDEELDEALPDDAPPAKFICKCDTPFDTWQELGDHQTETGHVGMWAEPNDALDDDALSEREDTVDGTSAKIKHDKPKGQKIEKVDYSHLWRNPNLDIDMVLDLQQRIDDGELTMGGIAAGKACIGKGSFTDPNDGSTVEVGCPHKCFARTVRKNECSLEHTHSETLEQVCLIHAITAWGAEIPPAGNGPLFGADA
jgi:hypothetical protein